MSYFRSLKTLPLLGTPILVFAMALTGLAGKSQPPHPEYKIVTVPQLRQPEPHKTLNTESLKVRRAAVWIRYEERVASTSQLLIDAMSRSKGYPLLSDEHAFFIHDVVDPFRKTGEIAEELNLRWRWGRDWAPFEVMNNEFFISVMAVGRWARREYAKAIQHLEEDYVLLANECEASNNHEAARHIRKELALVLDSDWQRQNAIISSREETIQREEKARWEQQTERRKKLLSSQRKPLDEQGVNQADLVEGKPFKTTGPGRLLNLYLRGTKWTNTLGVIYEWDDQGRLWYTQGQKRKLIYAEYADNNECMLQSLHVEVTKLIVDKKAKTITPQLPSGRNDRSLTRVEEVDE